MSKRLLNQLKDTNLGDLIRVEWYDASVGRSMGGTGAIDVPVKSYGIFLGVLGEKLKHIILCQNSFKYTNGVYDVDYTAIPVGWALTVSVVQQGEVTRKDAEALLKSFLLGRARTVKRRVHNHE